MLTTIVTSFYYMTRIISGEMADCDCWEALSAEWTTNGCILKQNGKTNWKFENYNLLYNLLLIRYLRMVFNGKECFLRPNVYRATNMHFKSCRFLLVSSINAYKCHKTVNFLLTSLARSLQKNIGPRSFCTNLALRARSVQKSISSYL